MKTDSLEIAIVAGEYSGDQLGAALMKSLLLLNPGIRFYGIGGEKMHALGFESFYPMEKLAVMGITEVLGRLPELILLRRELAKKITVQKPNIFIGIDAPDFNLGLEKKLKQKNIKTVHYVSPSVWAWRQGRIKKIKKSVDRMLTLLPFEKQFYDEHDMPATFIGHMLADEIPLAPDIEGARQELCLSRERPVVGVLPGSRNSEIKNLAPVFLQSIRIMLKEKPEILFVIPAVDKDKYTLIQEILCQDYSDLNDSVVVLEGRAKTVMEAADVVLLTSGTATLEAMLYKKPMVVAYKWGAITHKVIISMFKAEFFSLPNLLAGEKLVPELLQDEVNAEILSELVLDWFKDEEKANRTVERFTELHHVIKKDASHTAAEVIMEIIRQRNEG